jgi:hypothetical protein
MNAATENGVMVLARLLMCVHRGRLASCEVRRRLVVISAMRQCPCTNRFGFPYRKLEAVLLAMDDLTALVTKASLSFFSAGRRADQIEHDGAQPGDGYYQDELFAHFGRTKRKPNQRRSRARHGTPIAD